MFSTYRLCREETNVVVTKDGKPDIITIPECALIEECQERKILEARYRADWKVYLSAVRSLEHP